MIKSFANKLDYEIPKELRKYIVSVIHGESESAIDLTYPVHPTGFSLIIYVYGDIPLLHVDALAVRPQTRLHVAGQIYNADVNIEIKGVFGQIGLVLYPSAPYYLFHKSGDYFLNRWKSFTEASPINSKQMYSELSKSEVLLDRVSILLEFLKELSLKSIPAIDWLDESLQQIFMTGGNIIQKELIEKSAISARHFRRKFKEVIGVSPKYFCKIVQLNAVFELLKSSDDTKLLHLALDCGYYDQAHFMHDFKKLIGDSPRNFLISEHAYVKSYLGSGRT